jgi:plastocyanin
MRQRLQAAGIVILVLGVVASLGVSLGAGCSSSKSTNPTSKAVFVPKDVSVSVGDTIIWVAIAGTHSVTSGTGPSDPHSGDLFDQDLDSGQTFAHVFNTAGVFDYYCRPHEADGMKGTVTVTAIAAKTQTITLSGTSFSPANPTIHVGDTVTWVDASGSHTTTSGTGPADPNAGDLWDHSMSTGGRFSRVFDNAGSFPYFCRIHVSMGMHGTITVQANTPHSTRVEARMQ